MSIGHENERQAFSKSPSHKTRCLRSSTVLTREHHRTTKSVASGPPSPSSTSQLSAACPTQGSYHSIAEAAVLSDCRLVVMRSDAEGGLAHLAMASPADMVQLAHALGPRLAPENCLSKSNGCVHLVHHCTVRRAVSLFCPTLIPLPHHFLYTPAAV